MEETENDITREGRDSVRERKRETKRERETREREREVERERCRVGETDITRN